MTQNTKTTDSASKFQPGDKIKFTDEKYPSWMGQEGVVERTESEIAGDLLVKYRVTKAAPTDLGSRWNTVGGTCENFASCLTLIEDEEPAEDSGVGLSRYTKGMPEGIEARHIMETQDWYPAFCKGSILKYITRLDHKGQYLSDLNKIKTYAEELIRLEESSA